MIALPASKYIALPTSVWRRDVGEKLATSQEGTALETD